MMWVVDTCVLIDVCLNDPKFGVLSARMLDRHRGDGLTVSPVTMVEMAAVFSGDMDRQRFFLDQVGVDYAEAWTMADTEASQFAWANYVRSRRLDRSVSKRPVAEILIGGFASNRRGLLTRNARDFRRWFSKLSIKER